MSESKLKGKWSWDDAGFPSLCPSKNHRDGLCDMPIRWFTDMQIAMIRAGSYPEKDGIVTIPEDLKLEDDKWVCRFQFRHNAIPFESRFYKPDFSKYTHLILFKRESK